MLKINDIYKPIDQNINKMKEELNKLITSAGIYSIDNLFHYFFNKSGKHLRPALVFLSAGAINNVQSDMKNDDLIQLALALELLHSASLVHDDIIDKDLTRRGQKTLNNKFGNKIAVLVGDTLFAYSYGIISSVFPREYSQAIADLSFKMCVSEIEQTKDSINREKYFKIIKGKTALFTSICCKLGATFAGATESQIKSIESFGLNFGMAYQIMDDYMDEDPNALNNVTLEEAYQFANKGKEAIVQLEDSIYKEHLFKLMDYVMTR